MGHVSISAACEELEDPRLVQLYEASVELTRVGLNTVMAPTVAQRFAQAMRPSDKRGGGVLSDLREAF